jgi:hypothetical protein
MYCPINEATQTPQDDFEINKQSRLSLECILNSEKINSLWYKKTNKHA